MLVRGAKLCRDLPALVIWQGAERKHKAGRARPGAAFGLGREAGEPRREQHSHGMGRRNAGKFADKAKLEVIRLLGIVDDDDDRRAT